MATEHKVKSIEVTIGMFVAGLDRPWVESPFAFQGFTIKSQSDIDLIQRTCDFVYVDVDKSAYPTAITDGAVHDVSKNKKRELTLDDITHHNTVSERSPTHEEFKRALLAYNALERTFTHVVKDIQKGNKLKLPLISKTVIPLITSIRQNPDAMLQILMLDSRQATLASDAITTAFLSAAIGHRIGVKNKQLLQLAVGGLLYDVGKLALPKELLDQPRKFTPAEYKVVKSHVSSGVDIIKAAIDSQPAILTMVQHHHERFNGSGYPSGMSNQDIPVFARIASIVDCFNAITSHRPHAQAMSPYHASLKIYEWREVDFDPQLVEQLIQVVGVYPIGTPIELSNGEIAVVVAHNKSQRLRPVVAVLLNSDKKKLKKPRILDLGIKPSASDGAVISIKTTIESGVYELNMKGILDSLYEDK